jgi:hypothetical protein
LPSSVQADANDDNAAIESLVSPLASFHASVKESATRISGFLAVTMLIERFGQDAEVHVPCDGFGGKLGMIGQVVDRHRVGYAVLGQHIVDDVLGIEPSTVA